MITTLDDVKAKKVGQSAEETAVRELVRLGKEQGLSLTGHGGLAKKFESPRV